MAQETLSKHADIFEFYAQIPERKLAIPKDAAAIVLRRENQVCWAQRSAKLSFLSGWHAFPGGKVEESDADISVKTCDDKELAKLIIAAARECFEETGVLLARGGDTMTTEQRALLHDDLVSARMTFAEILRYWNLWLDATDFTFVGTWTTPAFSPVRFKTRFFLVECPPQQTPFAATAELEKVGFVSPEDALQQWQNGEILCAPPILNTLRAFSNENFKSKSEKFDLENSEFRLLIDNLLALAKAEGANPRTIEFNPHIVVFPLQTLTLPPATHTNCFMVGRKQFVVIDAAARDAREQTHLHEFVDSLIADGGVCQAIVTSHLHLDHVGGETVLQLHLREKHNQSAPLAAHRLTVESLPHIKFDRLLEDGDTFNLQDADANKFELQVLHLPGHAHGHLCFYDQKFGFLLASDNVAGTNSVLVAPPEGNMSDYLHSLERMRKLPGLRFLCGSHGAAIADAPRKIENYIRHRREREREILNVWETGARTPRIIVERVYADTKPELRSWAEKSVAAHLEKLRTDGLIEL